MQSYNESELIDTKQGTVDELKKRIDELEGKATHHVIGHLPKKGNIVTINGLRFKVVSMDAIKGSLRAKILKPPKH